MIKELLTSLKMTGALEALDHLNTLKNRDSFLIALLKAEVEYRDLRSNKRRLYPNNFKNWHFGGAKAPKFGDRKPPHIVNIGWLTIIELRKLSHCPNTDF